VASLAHGLDRRAAVTTPSMGASSDTRAVADLIPRSSRGLDGQAVPSVAREALTADASARVPIRRLGHSCVRGCGRPRWGSADARCGRTPGAVAYHALASGFVCGKRAGTAHPDDRARPERASRVAAAVWSVAAQLSARPLRADVDVLVHCALGQAGVAIVGELYAGASMSLDTQVHVWNPLNPSASSSAPVSRGSRPGTRSRVSVQTARSWNTCLVPVVDTVSAEEPL
jgi:hypothetical protein